MVVTVFSVSLTWPHVVILQMVIIVETGIYFPNGTKLPFTAPNIDTYEDRLSQGVDLRRSRDVNSPTAGIYRCGIPTDAVHDDTDRSVRDTVYVGLYTASGGMLLMC